MIRILNDYHIGIDLDVKVVVIFNFSIHIQNRYYISPKIIFRGLRNLLNSYISKPRPPSVIFIPLFNLKKQKKSKLSITYS